LKDGTPTSPKSLSAAGAPKLQGYLPSLLHDPLARNGTAFDVGDDH
jgi:hypothetical protein